MLDYWKAAVGQYVRECRESSEKKQKELPVSRDTISQIERGTLNFSIDILLRVLEAVGGDISEAFRSRAPRQPHKEDQILHDQLQVILERGDQNDREIVEPLLRKLAREALLRQEGGDVDAPLQRTPR